MGCSTITPPSHAPDIHIFQIRCCGSMEPTIQNGDLVHVDKNFPFEDLEIGDVIEFQTYQKKLLHRIIGSDEGGWVMKGDAHRNRDITRVTKDNYLGKMVKIESLGLDLPDFYEKIEL